MPSSRAYQYSAVDMKTVMSNPEEYIIPENLEACRLLWSKNIFTKMNNNYDNDYSWITINTLSPENQELFNSLSLTDRRVGLTYGGFGFKIPIVPGPGNDTFAAFKELIDLFHMQDVQTDGYMTVNNDKAFRIRDTGTVPRDVVYFSSTAGDTFSALAQQFTTFGYAKPGYESSSTTGTITRVYGGAIYLQSSQYLLPL